MHSHTCTHTHARTHTRLGMSGTNPQALLSPWHRPKPLGFSVMATTIFCQHWTLSSPVPTACKNPCTNYPDTPLKHRTEPSTKTNKGCVLSSFCNAKKKINQEFIRLIPLTASKPQLWQDVSGNEKLASWGCYKLHHGILTASGADEGHTRTLTGTVTLRKHELVWPQGHSTL